ncbi:RNA polymerase sigma factor, partial [Nonomuraea aridisoli]
MTQPITDQRPRAELIAELYDLHAAGMFAYCADQLGDLGSASDVLAAVFSGVPAVAPPRAALYAFARREIHRRDVLYSPPAVDPLTDPATALVERALRELRPHQREVLVLCAVCELGTEELAWVLGVASDTAEELVMSAGQRFRQSLGAALASTGPRLPKPVADVFGALAVAPLPDVLGRLPWPQPPGALRIHFAGSRTATPGPLFVKPRWPSPPVWPQPPARNDPASSTVIFPAELLTPPSGDRAATHEATTAPMPKYRDTAGDGLLESPAPLRDPLGSTRAFRLPQAAPAKPEPSAPERPFFLAAPPATGVEPFATGDVILPKGAPDPYMTGDVLVHQGPARSARRQPPPSPEPQPTPVEFLRLSPPDSDAPVPIEEPVKEAAPLFQPRSKPAEPVYRLPKTGQQAQPTTEPAEPEREEPKSVLAPRPVRSRP